MLTGLPEFERWDRGKNCKVVGEVRAKMQIPGSWKWGRPLKPAPQCPQGRPITLSTKRATSSETNRTMALCCLKQPQWLPITWRINTDFWTSYTKFLSNLILCLSYSSHQWFPTWNHLRSSENCAAWPFPWTDCIGPDFKSFLRLFRQSQRAAKTENLWTDCSEVPIGGSRKNVTVLILLFLK